MTEFIELIRVYRYIKWKSSMSSVLDFKIISKPNCSLTPSTRVAVFLLIAIIPVIIAIVFALAGVWMILPFAGLELLALAGAFYYVNCHAQDYESITIDDAQLVVEKRNYKQTIQTVLNPYWAKVVLRKAPNGEAHLWLRSHGKSIKVGSFMNTEERIKLAQQLQLRTGEKRNNSGTN